jgi:hypothetical protein
VVETPLHGPSADANDSVSGVTGQDAQEIVSAGREPSGAHAATMTDGDLRGAITKSVRDPERYAG